MKKNLYYLLVIQIINILFCLFIHYDRDVPGVVGLMLFPLLSLGHVRFILKELKN